MREEPMVTDTQDIIQPNYPAPIPHYSKKSNYFFSIGLFVVGTILGAIGFWKYQGLLPPKVIPVLPTPTTSPSTYTNYYSKIKYLGPISDAKTLNTDNWKTYSNKLTETKKINYSYQLPENLYVAPNVRGGLAKLDDNSLYFFENQETYKKYFSCLQDKTPSKESGVIRDWEGGCDTEGNLLYRIVVSFSDSNLLQLSINPPYDLTSYKTTDGRDWYIPIPDGLIGDYNANIYAVKENDSGSWVRVDLSYPPNPDFKGAEEKIKLLTNLNPYQLLIHILSTFKFAE